MFKLDQHTIFLTLAGSQAHGTARLGSDVDVRGVCIAPVPVRVSLFKTFEQYEGELPPALAEQVISRIKEHPTAARGLGVKTECVIYDVAKFLRLCAAANPSALEILFASDEDWLLAAPAWRRLHAERAVSHEEVAADVPWLRDGSAQEDPDPSLVAPEPARDEALS